MKFVSLLLHDGPNKYTSFPIETLNLNSYLGEKCMKQIYYDYKKTNEDEIVAYNEFFDGCQIQSNWEHYDKNGYSRK